MYKKINTTSERKRDFLNQGAPLINIHSEEKSGFPCPCQSLDGPIVRFYSPITGKIYVRTFSAGGARIPVTVGMGCPVPRSMVEIKDLLQVHKPPRTPLHLPTLPSEPSLQDRLRNQVEFYDVYHSKRKISEAENHEGNNKLPMLVRQTLKNNVPECGLTSWNSTLETPKQPAVQKIPRLTKVSDRYRKPTLEDKGVTAEEKTKINHSTNNMPKVISHGKLPPLVNERNDCKVDMTLQEWREKVRKCNHPLDEDSPLPSKGRIPKETIAPEIVTKVTKHKYTDTAHMREGESRNLLTRAKPDGQSAENKSKNTRLLWKHEVADTHDYIESDCDFASHARISDINIEFPTERMRIKVPVIDSDSVNSKNDKTVPNLPNIYESPSNLKQRSREQLRKEVTRENLRTLSSTRQLQMKRSRLQRSTEKPPEPEEDPALLIRKAIKKMKSTSWNESAKGLEETVQLSNIAPQLLEPYMNTVYRHLVQLLRSLRSTVVRIACNVARELFRTMKCTLRPEFDEIGGILVHKTADTNRFIREDANCALDEMITHIPALNTVRVLVDKGATHKNALVRIAVARLLTCVVALTGAENILGPKGSKETRKKLLTTIAKFMDDCSLETRDYARNLYKQLLEYEDFEYHFHNDVDNNILRHIEKTMIKLKYDNEPAFEEEEEDE